MAEPGEPSDVAHSGDELAAIHERRFSAAELADKRVLWQTLCETYLQQFVPEAGTVLDLGAGSCEFINSIRAARRIAVDMNPRTADHAAAGVEVLRCPSTDLSPVPDRSVDTVFASDFFEHLPSKAALLQTLRECKRVLEPGGRLVVLMPNLRYLPGRYWDYLDHHLPLTHVSVVEALDITGFGVEIVHGKFLPYTVKDSPIPLQPWMVRLYLRLPPLWRILGRQMLVVARA